MELITVEKLAKLFVGHGLTKLDVSDGTEHYIFERSASAAPVCAPAVQIPAAEAVIPDAEEKPSEKECAGDVQTASLVGTVYLAPAEGKAPFVSVGDSVKKGDTVCIIEAMKILNEIPAERDGVIKEILVKNEDTVEYGQGLFVIG